MRLKWPRRQRDSDSHELSCTVKLWIALSIGCIPNFSLYCIWVCDEQPSKCLNSIRQESGGQELGDKPRRIVSSIPLQCHKHRIGQLNFSWTVFLLREDGCKAARVSTPNGRVGYVVPRPEKGNEKFLLSLVVTNMRRTYTSSKSRTAPPLGSGGHMIVHIQTQRSPDPVGREDQKKIYQSISELRTPRKLLHYHSEHTEHRNLTPSLNQKINLNTQSLTTFYN
jgi:hypothetical protein